MRNVFIKLEYDGTSFHGWQIQPRKRTVQGEVERVLTELCRVPIKLNGVSRTDAGVHAFCQCASFKGDFKIPVDRLIIAANHMLCGGRAHAGNVPDVRIIHAEEVPMEFHARYDAVGKKYVYRILETEQPDIFLRNQCWQVNAQLDIDAMRIASRHIVGEHDFKAFQAAGGKEMETTVRKILGLSIARASVECGRRALAIEVIGDGFLYNMVRIITGTLVYVGLGKKRADDVSGIIASMDRQNAGPTAPPQGLYLAEVYYKEEDMNAAASAFVANTMIGAK